MKRKKVILLEIIFLLCFIIASIILNQNSNIKKEKKVIKEMTESEYDSSITELNKSHENYAIQVQENKKKLAQAISNENVNTSENATVNEMVTNIGKILEARTKDATATSDDIEEEKTAYVNGKLITGTKSNVGYGEVYYDFGYRTWVDVRNVKTLSYYGNKINGQTNLNIIYGLKGESNKYNYDNGTVIHNTSTSEGNLYTIDISDYDYLELYLLAGAKEMVFSK